MHAVKQEVLGNVKAIPLGEQDSHRQLFEIGWETQAQHAFSNNASSSSHIRSQDLHDIAQHCGQINIEQTSRCLATKKGTFAYGW